MLTHRGLIMFGRKKGKDVARKATIQQWKKKIYKIFLYLEYAKIIVYCFLWVTAPCLEQGLELIRAWGFNYKTVGFTWVKQNKKSDSFFTGMGYYTRANAEYCLIATKGKILERKSHAVNSVVCSHIERHSKKPNEVRDRIVQLFGDIPRIELFAREYADGWDCWGNEV